MEQTTEDITISSGINEDEEQTQELSSSMQATKKIEAEDNGSYLTRKRREDPNVKAAEKVLSQEALWNKYRINPAPMPDVQEVVAQLREGKTVSAEQYEEPFVSMAERLEPRHINSSSTSFIRMFSYSPVVQNRVIKTPATQTQPQPQPQTQPAAQAPSHPLAKSFEPKMEASEISERTAELMSRWATDYVQSKEKLYQGTPEESDFRNRLLKAKAESREKLFSEEEDSPDEGLFRPIPFPPPPPPVMAPMASVPVVTKLVLPDRVEEPVPVPVKKETPREEKEKEKMEEKEVAPRVVEKQEEKGKEEETGERGGEGEGAEVSSEEGSSPDVEARREKLNKQKEALEHRIAKRKKKEEARSRAYSAPPTNEPSKLKKGKNQKKKEKRAKEKAKEKEKEKEPEKEPHHHHHHHHHHHQQQQQSPPQVQVPQPISPREYQPQQPTSPRKDQQLPQPLSPRRQQPAELTIVPSDASATTTTEGAEGQGLGSKLHRHLKKVPSPWGKDKINEIDKNIEKLELMKFEIDKEIERLVLMKGQKLFDREMKREKKMEKKQEKEKAKMEKKERKKRSSTYA